MYIYIYYIFLNCLNFKFHFKNYETKNINQNFDRKKIRDIDSVLP